MPGGEGGQRPRWHTPFAVANGVCSGRSQFAARGDGTVLSVFTNVHQVNSGHSGPWNIRRMMMREILWYMLRGISRETGVGRDRPGGVTMNLVT